MSIFTLEYQVSEELQEKEYIETGVPSPSFRKVEIELDTKQVRKAATYLFGFAVQGQLFESRITAGPPHSRTVQARDKVSPQNIELTPKAAKAAIVERAKAARVAIERYQHEEREREEERATAQRKEQKRIDNLVENLQKKFEAQDFQAIVQTSLPSTANYSTAITIKNQAKQKLREMREAEKAEWIQNHGSDHLQRAFNGGYDCQRLYTIERSDVEAPGFTIDFDAAARWSSRSCPSKAALDLADSARELGLGEPMVVWLKEPPSANKNIDIVAHDEQWFEPCEAILIKAYLGKYELFQIG